MTTEEKVLNYCNRLRQEYGKRPLKKLKKGYPGNCYSCIISNTLGFDEIETIPRTHDPMGYVYFQLDDGPLVLDMPKYVNKFALDFDNHKYPELEL